MSEFISLYSGSSGNSSVVRCGSRYLIVDMGKGVRLSLIHISEPTRLLSISYDVFC